MTCDNVPSWSKKSGSVGKKNDCVQSEDRTSEPYINLVLLEPCDAKEVVGIIHVH